MKYISCVCFLIALTGCSKHSVVSPVELSESKAINFFKEICVDAAPSFDNSETIARQKGIELSDDEVLRIGFNEDKSIGLQVKHGKSCVITTRSQSDSSLTSNFLTSIAHHLGKQPAKKVPFIANIRDSSFIFFHDRKNGEAFVMLKK